MPQEKETMSYLASDGQHVLIPPPKSLPNQEFDPTPYRDEIRESALKANTTRYYRLEAECKSIIQNVNSGMLAQRPETEKKAILDAAERILDAVSDAKLRFDTKVEKATDNVITSLSSVEQMTQFHVALSQLLGFHFTAHSGGEASNIKMFAPWLLELLEVMPDSYFAAMLRTFRNPVLFNSYFPFCTPRLRSFLNEGISDVRHLENDISKPHIYADYPIDLRNSIIRHETGVGPSFVFDGDKPIDLRINASVIPEILDLDITYDDIFTVYHPDGETFLVGFLASIMAIDEKPYRGQMLNLLIYDHKDTGLLKAPQQAIWPYFAEQLHQIDAALNGTIETGQRTPKTLLGALKAITVLPAVPVQSVDALKRIASDGNRWEQKLANSILEVS